MNIGIVGSRKISNSSILLINKVIKKIIQNKNIKEITFGGTAKADIIALYYSAEYMIKYNRDDIDLTVIVPDRIINQPDIAQSTIINLATNTIELGLKITPIDGYNAFVLRDLAIINNSDLMIVFWNGEKKSRTYKCIQMSKKLKKDIIIYDIN